ncbi:MAG: glycosyl transferase family 1, partial [Gammaproteobacteria bacterium]|nr:glycosyl transferase family 1 [Gammaproteobacteria bacterium]
MPRETKPPSYFPKETILPRIEDYEPLVGAEVVERVLKKAEKLEDHHMVNVSSTYYGGGVAELLSSETLLFNSLGIKTGWRIIQGAPDFFSVTKKMHNALQGAEINLSDLKKQIYQEVMKQNVARNHLEHHDMVIVHDPQPLGLIGHYRKHGPWIWRCHVDLSSPNEELWEYLKPSIERYDA